MELKNPFEEYTEIYDSWFIENDQLFEAELNAIRELLPPFNQAIEVGVGTGLFAQALGIPNGIEPSAAMRSKAESRGLCVIDALAEEIPIPDSVYDLVVMVTVDCFLNDIQQAYQEIYRILKSDGTFIIAFIDRSSSLGIFYDENKCSSPFYSEANFHTAQDIQINLQQAGFDISDSRQTIFTLANQPQEVRSGTGDGVFAVYRANKRSR